MQLVYTNDDCIGCNKCIRACSCMGACVADEINNLASDSKLTATKSNESQGKVLMSVQRILNETKELMNVIAGINDRTQNLAAATEEIAAASNVILTTADEVKATLATLVEQ